MIPPDGKGVIPPEQSAGRSCSPQRRQRGAKEASAPGSVFSSLTQTPHPHRQSKALGQVPVETREGSVISMTGGELGPAGRGAQAVGGPLPRGASRVTSRSSPVTWVASFRSLWRRRRES